MTDIVFNEQQQSAIDTVVQWFKGWQDRRHRKQLFFLSGYAGTGKTTVAKEIAERCGGMMRVVFIAPTGKAASRLRQKGCKYAKTLHQFVYNVRGEDEEGEPIFVGKGALDEKPLLVILDEASMVGEYDLNTLMQHGIPVLALGDIGQIPPVKAAQVFLPEKVDFMLETIERQGADSNIIRASMFARQGKMLPFREYEDVRVRKGHPSDEDIREHLGEDGVMLCSYNTTRAALNLRSRDLLGFSGEVPQVGEKVVCLFNQHGYGIMNGEQGIVEAYHEIPEEERDEDGEDDGKVILQLKSLTDGKVRRVKFNPLSFSKDEEVRKEAVRAPGGFDYGYALTVHKSQGSEWPNVLVVEETMRGIPYAQLSYTAFTRAQDRLTIWRNS